MALERVPEIMTGVLAATVTVKDQASLLIQPTPEARHLQRIDHKLSPHVLAQRPAHYLAAEQVDDHRQKLGLPENPHPKAVNVDCSEYFQSKDPAKSEFIGTFCHAWHIGDPVFALDLAMTLEGAIDRMVIPCRRNDGGHLTLIAGQKRPVYQGRWC